RARVEQDACGLERAGGQYHNLGARFAVRMRGAVDVIDTFGLSLRVHENMTDHRAAYQCQATGPRSLRQRHRGAVEIRRRVTASLTLIAIVACWATAMDDRQVRHAVGHDDPAEILADHLARQFTPAGKVHWRQEFTIRHLLEALARSAHPDK